MTDEIKPLGFHDGGFVTQFDPDEFLIRIGAGYGLSYEQMTGQQDMTRAEVEARVEAYREDHKRIANFWNARLQPLITNSLLAFMIADPRNDLRFWRSAVARGDVSKRAWRRYRGRVKAGKPIPPPPDLFIDFEVCQTRCLAPFIRYQKD